MWRVTMTPVAERWQVTAVDSFTSLPPLSSLPCYSHQTTSQARTKLLRQPPVNCRLSFSCVGDVVIIGVVTIVLLHQLRWFFAMVYTRAAALRRRKLASTIFTIRSVCSVYQNFYAPPINATVPLSIAQVIYLFETYGCDNCTGRSIPWRQFLL